MSKNSSLKEVDIEMGKSKHALSLCFDCVEEDKQDNCDDTSRYHVNENNIKRDEDDLGDNEDEYKQELSNIIEAVNDDINLPSISKQQDSFDCIVKDERENADITILHNIEDFWEANSESEDEEYLDTNAKHPLEQISFEKLKKKIYKDFDVNLIHRYSSALDILASYIKYHVIIYTEASYYCNFKLNLFMVPAILFSTICSIITGITHNNKNMSIFVASLNGFVAFLIAIINYLKLDASAEAHKISAYQYSKLKNYIEFSSGEILLFQDPIITNKSFISEQIQMWEKNNKMMYNEDSLYQLERNKKLTEFHKYKSHLEKKLIDTIQNKIFEIKKSLKNIEDNNNFILPKHINARYYNIYNINVFSYIKSIENYKLILLNNLRNVKNEIRFYRLLEKSKNGVSEEKMVKIKTLHCRKNNILTEFLELNKGFMLIDTMFQQEIKNIKIRKKYWIIFKIQGFVKLVTKCCCCHITTINILPVGYKQCTHVGFVDDQGRYLLDKILRSNNVISLE
jgi:hypothetical protein|tara:strand:+ start:4110 stop:5645 length:1536 start_codon:yes stop_codon:yes gene_type:complete